jgi:molybdenum cofactor biosynthesis enzyme MoaA
MKTAVCDKCDKLILSLSGGIHTCVECQDTDNLEAILQHEIKMCDDYLEEYSFCDNTNGRTWAFQRVIEIIRHRDILVD